MQVVTSRIRQRVWRILSPRWAHLPTSGDGAANYGGRWNSKGNPAFYASLEFDTAIAEYQQDLGFRPGTFCAYDVDVGPIVDLRQIDVVVQVGLEPQDRHCAWKQILLIQCRRPPTWDAADRLTSAGVAGALVPSAIVMNGTNLVLWRWNDRPDNTILPLDPLQDLPSK